MPIYEYCCKACGAVFSRNMSVHEHDHVASMLAQPMHMAVTTTEFEGVRCPKCNDIRVEQQLSSFFAKTSRKS